jgi:hypothetical protein
MTYLGQHAVNRSLTGGFHRLISPYFCCPGLFLHVDERVKSIKPELRQPALAKRMSAQHSDCSPEEKKLLVLAFFDARKMVS